ncbi:hypothetical protein [Streptomyces thermolilacinus]
MSARAWAPFVASLRN